MEIKRYYIPKLPRNKYGYTSSSGGNVIISNNTTGSSSSKGATLQSDVLTDVSVGFIPKNITLAFGMTFTEFVERMFTQKLKATLTSRISTANDVEIGSPKGVITYTTKRNKSGAMKAAYIDNDTELPITFSDEDADGVQTATRTLEGFYTDNESYYLTVVFDKSADIEEETTLTSKISVNVKRKWFAGVVYSTPNTSDEIRELASSGLFNANSTNKFSVGTWKSIVIAVPASSTVTSIEAASYFGNFIEDVEICKQSTITVMDARGDNPTSYNMYLITSEIENAGDTFTFKCN